MELKLEQEELLQVLLDWAQASFPGKFNKVHFGGYTYNQTAVFTKEVEEVTSE